MLKYFLLHFNKIFVQQTVPVPVKEAVYKKGEAKLENQDGKKFWSIWTWFCKQLYFIIIFWRQESTWTCQASTYATELYPQLCKQF